MDREAFAAPQRAHVMRATTGYHAFCPPPLPPTLDLGTELVGRLSAADRAIGELAGLGRSLPNPHLLSRGLMRREAVLSSRIEGTQASLSDLVLYEVEPDGSADTREVHNYLRAVDHVLAADRRLPVSLSLLREAHETLLVETRGGHATPGEFRTSQNWIGAPGATLGTATYVPPPPERLWECLDPFEKYLHVDGDLPPLMAIGAIHYQFEAIHPFLDGNGRVGRLLIILLMVEWGLLPAPLLDLSAYIEPRRDEYYRRLLAVSTDGDWGGWLGFFLDVVANQARSALVRARTLHDLRERMRDAVATGRSSVSVMRLVDELFDVPMLTIGRARDVLGVTHRAATMTIEKLVGFGILREVRPGRRPRLFVAPDIMRAVDSDSAGSDG